MAILVLDAWVGHDDGPYVLGSAPCLQLGQHQAHLLGLRGSASSLGHVYEDVGVYDEIVQPSLAHLLLRHGDDVVAVGQSALGVEIHHVAHQEAQCFLVLLPCLLGGGYAVQGGGVAHAQGYAGYVPDVLRLLGQLKAEVGYALLAVVHQMGGEAVEEVGLARVWDAREHDEPALVGGVEDAVGEGAHAHVISLVVHAHHGAHDFVLVLGQVVYLVGVHLLRLADDAPHLVGSECLVGLADVLHALWQRYHLGPGLVSVQELDFQSSARLVFVAADDDFLRLEYPFLECLVALLDVGGGAVGYAEHVGESAGQEGEPVLLALGEDELVDGFGSGAQGVQAVDAVGGAGLVGGYLLKVLAPLAREGIEAHGAQLHVDDAPREPVAVGDGWHGLGSLRVFAAPVVHSLAGVGAHHSLPLRHLGADAHGLEIGSHLALQMLQLGG